MIFQKEDRVIYTSDRFQQGRANPRYGGFCGKIKGTIIQIHHSPPRSGYLDIRVRWDNNMINNYDPEDLKFAPGFKRQGIESLQEIADVPLKKLLQGAIL